MGANANMRAGAASCAYAITSDKSITEPRHSGKKCILSNRLQVAAYGYTARTLAFALALRFLKRNFLALISHIRCSTFTWKALQV